MSLALATGSVGLLVAAILTNTTPSAHAADPKVGLGTAEQFALLAGTTITNTGASVITGDLGLSPGSSVTGFPPGILHGTKHISDAVALQAKKDLATAYNDAAGRPMKTDVTGVDLAGLTLTPGVYVASTAMALTGDLTLNAQGNSASVFIFKAGSTLITGPNSSVKFVNGGSSCNVFWQVGSSATLNTSTDFIGTILAQTSVTLGTRADVEGRVLARSGAVTLDTNVITKPDCASSTPTGTGTATGTPTGTETGTGSPTGTGTATAGASETGTQTPGTGGVPSSGGSSGATDKPSTGADTPSDDTSGPSTPLRTPSVPAFPTGHPNTGLGGSQVSSSAPLFGLSGLTAIAALVMAGMGFSRSEKRRR